MRRRAQLRGKGLWEETCNHHESNKADWTAFAKVVAGTHQSVLWCFPCHIPASLGQVGCDRPGPPAHVKWKEWWWKTLCPGLDTHRSPHSALFSKTGGRRGSYAPFGHIGSRVRPQQRQRWRVEMCIFEWCEVVIGGLIEPSAGSRQWWNPGFSRVEKVACR